MGYGFVKECLFDFLFPELNDAEASVMIISVTSKILSRQYNDNTESESY